MECSICYSTSLTNCRHVTICFECCKYLAEKKEKCKQCGTHVTRFVTEHPVRLYTGKDKTFYGFQFPEGSPDYENGQWSIRKESQDDMESSMPNLILEDQTGDKIRYKGRHVPAAISSKYIMLVKQDDGSFVAVPTVKCYEFKREKVVVTQLTTEQAEMIMEQKDEQADRTIKKYKKRLRKGDPKLSATYEGETSDEKGEHWDHEDSESDDNTVTESSSSVPKAMREFVDKDNEAFLSNPGRDLKDLLNKHKQSDKNNVKDHSS